MFRPRSCPMVVAAFFSTLFFSKNSYSRSQSVGQNAGLVRTTLVATDQSAGCVASHFTTGGAACGEGEDRLSLELRVLGQRGELIASARRQALEILQGENSCSAWFREADADPAGVLRSVHFQLDENGTSLIYGMRDNFGALFYKHPWGATTTENAGRNSLVRINAHGAFFSRESLVMQLGVPSAPAFSSHWHILSIGFYLGDTPEARMAILLHELGHIVGRLPEDGDSWDGQSSRNTVEVLRHCKREIRSVARKNRVPAME